MSVRHTGKEKALSCCEAGANKYNQTAKKKVEGGCEKSGKTTRETRETDHADAYDRKIACKLVAIGSAAKPRSDFPGCRVVGFVACVEPLFTRLLLCCRWWLT